ncbi:MAG TPA: YggS family pyridoxal phosphate-dependent enzyme [Candidatus Acidoferrales bacterium]|nr:YggS family pyridoxal phosphate-dependent enzyme [Candidatus Acidoferrales bacterium]
MPARGSLAADEDGGTAWPAVVDRYASARANVLSRIESACARVGRDPSEVTLVAVTKTVPVRSVRAAIAAGFSALGENRVQDAAPKLAELAADCPAGGAIAWHLIGPLQSNKARRAVELFDVIETVDSLALARRLDRTAGEIGREVLPVLLQVNVDADPAKSGYEIDTIAADLPGLIALPRLRVLGLMTVGRLVSDAAEARPTFRTLRELSGRLRGIDPRLGPALSMGMSDDFEVAVEEGATIVRLGRAIFGDRRVG